MLSFKTKTFARISAALAMAAMSTTASAVALTGVAQSMHVTLVGEDESQGASGQLALILSDGRTYYGTPGTSVGCGIPVQSADAVKVWASLGQGALLSGKTVSIGYVDCNGNHYIIFLNLSS
jgi:hypothetical protein